MSQPNPEAIQVPQHRANEIFQGKAATTIKDLMVELAQVTAVAEQLGKELQAERQAHAETKVKLARSMSESIPDPSSEPSPQNRSDS